MSKTLSNYIHLNQNRDLNAPDIDVLAGDNPGLAKNAKNAKNLRYCLSTVLRALGMEYPRQAKNNRSRVYSGLWVGLLSILFLTTSTANAALSATTANTIQGTKPALSATLTNAIQTGGNFELFGLSNGTTSYYTQSDIDTHFFAGLNLKPTLNKPSDLPVLSLSLGSPSTVLPSIQASDNDGDGIDSLSEKVAGGVTLGWYKAGTNTPLTAMELGYTFCKLSAGGIVPELRASGAVTLKTTYGDPISQDYPDAAIGVTQTPKRVFDYTAAFDPTANPVCYAKPNISLGTSPNAGPASMWDVKYGFIPQATAAQNFPTTGADSLYFDLLITGVDATTLKWPGVGVTPALTSGNVTVTASVTNASTVKITLRGPKALAPSASSPNPYVDGATALAFTPSTFVIEGKDSTNGVKASYGFGIKKWYVNRGDKLAPAVSGSWVNPDGISYINQNAWCNGLNGGNYVLVKVSDLTNSSGTASGWGGTTPGALPGNPSGSSGYWRYIGGGLFSEWGNVYDYIGAGFISPGGSDYWTSDTTGAFQFHVISYGGYPASDTSSVRHNGVCTQP